jgi:hypothetical protein
MAHPTERTLFHVWGLRITADRTVPLSLLLLVVVLTLLATFVLQFPLGVALGMACAATILHVVSDFWHNLGHVVAARTTGYPMSGIRMYMLVALCAYPDNEPELAPAIHIRRALGGPIASALLSVIAGLLLLWVNGSAPATWVVGLWFAENLLLFTAQVLIPIGFNDGATIWHWMRVPRS